MIYSMYSRYLSGALASTSLDVQRARATHEVRTQQLVFDSCYSCMDDEVKQIIQCNDFRDLIQIFVA